MNARRAVSIDGRMVIVEVDPPGTVRIEGDAEGFEIRQVSHGEYLVERGGRRFRAWIAESGGRRQVFVNGLVMEAEVSREGSVTTRSPRRHTPETASAPMPATVVEIAVKAGDLVRQGDVLLELEAMKMEMPLRAPHDGRIVSVRCRPGDLVQPGELLVEMERVEL